MKGSFMNNWIHADSSDLRLYLAIEILYSNHKSLLSFLFHPSEARLRKPAEELLEELRGSCPSKETLIRLGLDLWSHEGNIPFHQILNTLDGKNLSNLICCLQFLLKKQSVGAEVKSDN